MSDLGLKFKAARADREAKAAARKRDKRRAREDREATSAERHDPLIVRVVNDWWNRLIAFAFGGATAAQTEQYAAHSTKRDYLWNSIGLGAWSMTFPLLTVVVTQLVGADDAGRLSMAFVVGNLLLFIANYGARTYQVSDVYEEHSFSDYQLQRVLTCIAMAVVGMGWCVLRGYDQDMTLVCMGVFVFRAFDGLADVYEGRLQQADKLYLAGISQAVRSLFGIVAFSVVLLVLRSLAFASIAFALGGLASLILLTIPITLLETPRSEPWSLRQVKSIFTDCFPVFAALFLYALIDTMPKFAMEGALSYDNQLYFNAMYFPAHGILTTANVIYKPQLVRLATIWSNPDPKARRRFDLLVFAMMAVIVAITVGNALLMGWVGIWGLGLMYGVDFNQFGVLVYLMVACGGVSAGIEFLYQIITVLRRQRQVMRIYLVATAASVPVCFLLVRIFGLAGAVWSNLLIMVGLFGVLAVQYFMMRFEKPKHEEPEYELPRDSVNSRESPTW